MVDQLLPTIFDIQQTESPSNSDEIHLSKLNGTCALNCRREVPCDTSDHSYDRLPCPDAPKLITVMPHRRNLSHN